MNTKTVKLILMQTPNEAIVRLKEIIARLRAPDGCPWDREQTHESIKPQLLEESFEVLEAIDEKNDRMLKEELGDVLLHIVFHSQLAAERGAFTLEDVINGVADKLVHRHPHVFGENKLGSSAEVLKQWDEIKKLEKPERTGLLHGIPKTLPALMQAEEIQKKAAKVGFDWTEVKDVLAKVREELNEVEQDLHNPPKAEEEIGDLFFTLTNLARFLKINPELAARAANGKFIRRFEWMEQNSPQPLKGQSLAELDELWGQAKRQVG
jgi:tetrapyrrole methylase family protein/MazG family protein